MPLRTANNPLAEATLLAALKPILVPNTQLAAGSTSGTGLELIYVLQKYAMSIGPFPAVLLSSGPQVVHLCSPRAYDGTHRVIVSYCDRWDLQTIPIDTIRQDIAQDLERMKANLENYLAQNRGFTVNSVVYPIEIIATDLSGYRKALEKDFPGLSLGCRELTIDFGIMPYAVR